MAYKRFLTSVADVFGYDDDEKLVFMGKTLMDSSIEVTLGSTPIKGGKGNKIQYIYYHDAEMNITLQDVQWNLAMLAESINSDPELGKYYKTETVTVSASGGGVVSGSPLVFGDATVVYGWAKDSNDTTQRVIFTSKTFTVVGKSGASLAGDYCVRYYSANVTEGQQITIKANIIPSTIKLVLEAQLNSGEVSANKIGVVQVIVPNAQLSGAFSIAMTADGAANTPLSAKALATEPTADDDACSSDSYYAKIIEIIDSTNWYDNIYDLVVSGGAFALTVGGTKTPTVYAVPIDSKLSAFKVSNSDLTWASSAAGSATVGAATGLVTAIAAGSADISMYVTSASTVDSSVGVTVTA